MRVGPVYQTVKWLGKWVLPPISAIAFLSQMLAFGPTREILRQIFQITILLAVALFVAYMFLTQEVSSYTYRCQACRHRFRVTVRPPLWKRPFYALIIITVTLFVALMIFAYVYCTSTKACV